MHNWVPRGSYKKMKLCREFDLEVPSPWMENQRSRSIGNTSRHLRALIGSENLEQITSKFSQKFQRRRNFGFCRSEYSRRFPFSSNLAIGNSWISMIENAKMHFHRIFPSFCLMDEHDIFLIININHQIIKKTWRKPGLTNNNNHKFFDSWSCAKIVLNFWNIQL